MGAFLLQITPEEEKLPTPTAVSSFRRGPPCSPDAVFSQTHRLVRTVKETLLRAQGNNENNEKRVVVLLS